MRKPLYLQTTFNKQNKLINSYNYLDCFLYPTLNKQQFTFKSRVESTNELSELNIIKAQKSILLKVFFIQKVKGTKNINAETFNFTINLKADNRSRLFYLLKSIQQLSTNTKTNSSYTYNYKDLLLELNNLNFHKINLNSLSAINIIFELFKSNDDILNKWLINETFLKKRL